MQKPAKVQLAVLSAGFVFLAFGMLAHIALESVPDIDRITNSQSLIALP